ncbi:DUF2797 domain-containing protein [Streptomyces qinzhouensis]|uniref:DUF2797 domain-containing protein n=1 Tax=Streptomyces qinzhouensis TaxID=2599401 RepID=A0A5B8IHI7_9ACTN|nr:DUF2797 domain-containing protein [Streptomyces qinzhouensis]QDY77742.1 DUF2797 domain-containing protein [Streptomyces qinzhouensis]
MTWRCTGVAWPPEARIPVLRWEGGRISPLTPGKRLGFRADGERVCAGARGNPCPLRAGVPGRAVRALCRDCAGLDRIGSVAADGVPDDPRTYRVYLAWFGPGMVKVGITAEERGPARLLEQGAVVFSWLGRGPLMAARRTEEVLRSALGVPDRIGYADKRAVRPVLAADPVERAVEVEELHRRALGVGGWTETLHPLPYEPVDHAAAFGLDRLVPAAPVVRQLVDGGAVAGTLVAVAGPDLHLLVGEERQVVLDTRLLAGWSLVGADPAGGVSVPLADAARSGGTQDGLF